MGANDADLRAELERLFFPDNAADGPSELEDESPPLDDAPPALPLEVLPDNLASWAEAVARAMPAPVDYVVAALLAAAGGALGGRYRLKVDAGWIEAPRLWCVLCGPPSSAKSPVLRRVAAPLLEVHRKLLALEEAEWAKYEAELERWENERRNTDDPPLRPTPPPKRRLVLTDTTREALAAVLADCPAGVLVLADELAGLVRDWTRYRDDGGRQAWLSLWDGAPLHVERKADHERRRRGEGRGYVYVDDPFVALLGGLQPRVVRNVSPVDGDDGFLARLLFAYAPHPPVPDALPPAPEDTPWAAVVEQLVSHRDRDYLLPFTPEAAEAFAEVRMWACREAANAVDDDHLQAVLMKVPRQVARLALVLEVLYAASAGRSPAEVGAVHAPTILRARALALAFVEHFRHVLRDARLTPEDRRVHGLVAWIRKRGGIVRARDIYTNEVAGIQSRDAALAALKDLERRGYGRVVTRGPSVEFHLRT